MLRRIPNGSGWGESWSLLALDRRIRWVEVGGEPGTGLPRKTITHLAPSLTLDSPMGSYEEVKGGRFKSEMQVARALTLLYGPWPLKNAGACATKPKGGAAPLILWL